MRGRGRPKKYADGTTAAEITAFSTAALKERGGARKNFRFSPAAISAIQALMAAPDAPNTETALIERLLIEAAKTAVAA